MGSTSLVYAMYFPGIAGSLVKVPEDLFGFQIACEGLLALFLRLVDLGAAPRHPINFVLQGPGIGVAYFGRPVHSEQYKDLNNSIRP